MKKKFLVTGGAGLIGSNIISLLNEKKIEDILVIDHIGNSEKWKNLSRLKFSDYIEKEKFNLEYEKIIKSFKPDFLIHEGACSSTTETDGTYLISNNFELTKNLAEVSLKKEISFIYASSAATYGLGEHGYSDQMEIDKLRPLNMYGYSKQLFDLYAQKKGWLKKITGLKYFNVFGFGEAHKADMRSVVLKGYEQISETGKLKLFKSYHEDYKDGEQKRDFLYVKDAAKITLYLLFQKKYGLYNVGRGIAESWNDLAKALFLAMKKEWSVEYIDMPDYLKPKYQYFTKADTTKLLASGYKDGFTNLEEAIQDYVELLRN